MTPCRPQCRPRAGRICAALGPPPEERVILFASDLLCSEPRARDRRAKIRRLKGSPEVPQTDASHPQTFRPPSSTLCLL
ncbi:unnamed protein product [Nesidiocoris tenuis]|uniref:Uncharacterized protein n=1 Tax=Nesidiocoris tenuis TaxID=355587 RepID=A0A6H5HCZ9_9HEMI|nr:unnamed protein product [Nesidiocoris tenuis]